MDYPAEEAAAAAVAANEAYQSLKVLFPGVSKAWLREHARHGAEVIADRIFEDERVAPPTRGTDTESEGEEQEAQQQPRLQMMPDGSDEEEEHMPIDRQAKGWRRRQRALINAIDEETDEEERGDEHEGWLRAGEQRARDEWDEELQRIEGDAAKENYRRVMPPARKVLKIEQRDDRLQPNRPNAAAAAAARQQDRAEDEEEVEEEEEEEEFVLIPIMKGEKCSGGCGQKPRDARVFCENAVDDGKKLHNLCVSCLNSRWAAGSLRRLPSPDHPLPLYYGCPMRNCRHRISSAELRAATGVYAPALHAFLMEELRKQRALAALLQQAKRSAVREAADMVRGLNEEAAARHEQQLRQLHPMPLPGDAPLLALPKLPAIDEEPVFLEPSTPTRNASLADAPRPARRLSWTPRRRADADAQQSQPDEEEPALTKEEEEDLRDMAALVDKEKLKELEQYFPRTAVGWLVRHSDYGMEVLIDMVHNQAIADPRLLPRADGRGATTIVQAVLAARKKFECSVCFADYDEHLAIRCVYLQNRRRTLMPGQVAPNAAQLAKDEAEQRKGTSEEHKFCADCVNGHARAAVEQNVIMKAGVGIKCMEPSCERALLRAHVDQVLDMQTRATLDPLFSNEALLAADCQDVEKCQRCPFAAVMQDREVQPVFFCANTPACGHRFCRKCGRTWDKAHKNRSCEELDPEAMRKRVEEQLTAAAMYRCPRCKRGIVKIDGCNKITCPCGQLSCYVCKAGIENYKHFKNGPADSDDQTKCPLWVDPTARIEKERQALLKQQIAGAADDGIRKELQALM